MKKNLSSIILLIILLTPATLAFISSIQIVSAEGNVTINDFSSNLTKGTIPLNTRLTANVTGEVTNWLWVFYNPQFNKSSYSSSNVTTKHTFGRTGVYGVFNVTLVVSGPGGNDTLKKIAYVVANKNTTGLPVAGFSASTTAGDAPLTVSFNDNSTDASSCIWYFGNKDTSIERNSTYTFTAPGKYRVVQVVNNINGWDATAQEIIVGGEQQEELLPKAAFEADTSDGFTVKFTDLSENEDAFTWDFGDGNSSTEHNPVHTYPAAGEYAVVLTISNEYGINSAVKTINLEAEGNSSDVNDEDDDGGSSHSSGGHSHSSGGVGGSPESQSNVEAKEISQTFITSGNPAEFDFTQNATPVMNISFDSKKTVGKITTIVETLKNKSTLTPDAPENEVYKYINIWVGSGGYGSNEDNLENAAVYFKVEKAWVQGEDINQSSITLNRYNNKKWSELPTTLLSEDDRYLYFTAETPGFSPFSITGKITEKQNNVEIQSETGDSNESTVNMASDLGSQSENEEKASTSEETTSTPEETTSTPGFEIVYGMAGLLAVFLYKRE